MKDKRGFYERYIKRVQDFFLSLIALIILSPILCVIAILIKVKIGSPIIFTQDRPGLNEKVFKMYKFRTMTDERDEEGNLLPDYIRTTKLGKFLRNSSLDELPELWNIVKGDMSLIGPRPLLVEYLKFYNDEQKRRHTVRPGLSGNAQVNGRNSITWQAKFKYDIEYVDKLSFMMDWKIIFLTIKKVFIREGINVNEKITMEPFRGTPIETSNDLNC